MDYNKIVSTAGRFSSDFTIFSNLGFMIETAVRLLTNPKMNGSAKEFFAKRCESHHLAAYGLGGFALAFPPVMYPALVIAIEHIGNVASEWYDGHRIWTYPKEYIPFNSGSSSVVSTLFFTVLMKALRDVCNIRAETL